MEIEIYVSCREQIVAALMGVSGEGCKAGYPFSIHLEGTNFRISAPNGMSETLAKAVIRNIRRTPAAVFKAPKEAPDA